MKLIRSLILCFFLISCSDDKKPVEVFRTIDYKDLKYICDQTHFPSLLEFR